MENGYGQAFKNLREARGFTLKYTAGEIVTPQFLSRFEKGESNISIENLGRLLIRIGAKWDDFFQYYEGESLSNALAILNKIENITSDYAQLKLAKQPLGSDYRDNPLLEDLIFNLLEVYKTTAMGLDKASIQDKIDQLTNHLAKIDTWGEFEILLYSSVIFECPFEMVHYQSNHFYKRLITDLEMETHLIRAYLQLIIDGIKYFSMNNHFKEADDFIEKLHSEFKKPRHRVFIHERIFLEMERTNNYLRQNKPDGIETGQKLLKLLDRIEKDFDMPIFAKYQEKIFWNIKQLNQTGIPFEI